MSAALTTKARPCGNCKIPLTAGADYCYDCGWSVSDGDKNQQAAAMPETKWHDVSDLFPGDFGADSVRWRGERNAYGHPIGEGYLVYRRKALLDEEPGSEFSLPAYFVRWACCKSVDEGGGFHAFRDLVALGSRQEATAFAEGHGTTGAIIMGKPGMPVALVNGGLLSAKYAAADALDGCINRLRDAAHDYKKTDCTANVKQADGYADTAAVHTAYIQGGLHALRQATDGGAES